MLKCVALCLNEPTAKKIGAVIAERFDLLPTAVETNNKGHVFVDCFSDSDFHTYMLCATMFLRGMEYALRTEAEKLRAERLALETR